MLARALLLITLPLARAQECAKLGCTPHKRDGWVCQCNVHCAAHGDCCADYAAACANATFPTTNRSSHDRTAGSAPAPANATNSPSSHVKALKEHNSGGKPSSSSARTHAKSTGSSSGSGSGGSHHATPSKGGSSKGSAKEREKEKERDKEKKEKEERESRSKGAHSGGHSHGESNSFPWGLVIFACVVALTVPITVALTLVFRARGICCCKSRFEAVHKDEAVGGVAMTPSNGSPAGIPAPVPVE